MIKNKHFINGTARQFYLRNHKGKQKKCTKLLSKYKKDVDNAIDIRLNSYVDPCYVDAGYVSPNSEPGKFRSIQYILNQNNSNTNITEI